MILLSQCITAMRPISYLDVKRKINLLVCRLQVAFVGNVQSECNTETSLSKEKGTLLCVVSLIVTDLYCLTCASDHNI